MIKQLYIIVLLGLSLIVVSCENSEEKGKTESAPVEKEVPEINTDYEEYINAIDFNDSLGIANSLSYANQEGESVEVELFLNDSNEIVKMRELIVHPNSSSILSNVFYLKEGKKFASKEYREVVDGDSIYFAEYRSYYDTAENVIATKYRTAMFEEKLEEEPFVFVEKRDLSMDRAMRVVEQKGEFETTFQGFVKMGGFLFLVVGENKKDGFASSLIVQQYTPLINKLKNNESQMLGTPLVVEFARVNDQGIQQVLLSVSTKS